MKKEKYRQLCRKEESISLFCKDWWLDSVCGDAWDVCIVEEKGQIVAALPYVLKSKLGLKFIQQPTLTQHSGPWFKKNAKNYSKTISNENKYIKELIEQLPSYDYLSINMHYENQNWLPFYWSNFKQTTKYTYLLPDLSDLDEVFSGFSSSYRGKIRKAEKLVNVKLSMAIEDFYSINEKTFRRQGINAPYSLEFVKRHDALLDKQNSRQIFYAHDKEGNIHSALYLTWDSKSAYVHMVGEDPEFRSSGAGILLIWEAIKYTKEILKLARFDFEGSMIEAVEKVRRDCGGIQTPYFNIYKANGFIANVLKAIKK
ncbi:GNAT family N-acetyltransferase [Vibrio vulnificus]|uniref:GNAT family N-acetyltransferase n=1 Tax=Vibrio vulnificus TaxID=672 RepID=UPI0040593913